MILVVGSTGLVGGMIARSLLERGDTVRVLVRPGSNYQRLVELGAELFFGDLKDPTSLAAACTGMEVVITTATSAQRTGADNVESVDLQGNRDLIEAARAANVRHLIYVSALLATEDHPVPLPAAKAKTERYLRESELSYTILAANAIMDVWLPMIVGENARAGRPVTLIGEGTRRHSFVAARDIANLAVASVLNSAALNARIAVGGPEAISWRDCVSAYERALGRELTVNFIAPGQLLPDVPPVPGLAELLSGLLASLEMFDSPVDMTQTVRTFGVRLTSVQDFVAQDVRSVTQVKA